MNNAATPTGSRWSFYTGKNKNYEKPSYVIALILKNNDV